MLIFRRLFTDPYLNIAAEEYFIRQAGEDICMIWINAPSVIIGKHQNAYAEINYPYVKANHIPVIRRISGGGAVYHDNGNVNFTSIKKTDKTNQVDFTRFTSIIIRFMQSLGIDVNTNKRNSLFAGSLKFSGHAEHIFHDRVLHHGTILFDTDLTKLQKCLNPEKDYQGKSLASVRSDVGNIAPLLSERIDIDQFTNKLIDWLMEYYPGSFSYQLQTGEMSAISKLAEEKYKTWDWNFGYSPEYTFKAEIQTLISSIEVSVNVKNGKIVAIDLPAETLNRNLIEIANSMKGLKHKEEEFDIFIENNRSKLELAGVNIVTFSEAFFR